MIGNLVAVAVRLQLTDTTCAMGASVYSYAEMPNAFGCRLWVGKLDRDGYGVYERTKAHIASWTEANGPVPGGKVLDHLCANRACCRLVHLQAVTQRENIFRKQWRYRSRIERCTQGHNLRLHAVVTPATGSGGNGLVCRICNQEGP